MNNEIEILFPDRDLQLSTGEVLRVRELCWREALEFLRLLSSQLSTVGRVTPRGAGANAASGDAAYNAEAGGMVGLLGQLPDLIKGADELTGYLAEKAAGLTPEKFGALAARDALAVLDKAIEINLNEELLARGKKLAGRFGDGGQESGVRRQETESKSSVSTTSSSGKDTPATSSTE
jgi:hypothetical protein